MACCVVIAYVFGLVLRPVRIFFGRRTDGGELHKATYGSQAGGGLAAAPREPFQRERVGLESDLGLQTGFDVEVGNAAEPFADHEERRR